MPEEIDLGIAPEGEVDLGVATVEPDIAAVPIELQKESQARQLTAYVLANESGLDVNDVIDNYANITEQLYGVKNMHPGSVLGRMEMEGKVITPEKMDEDISVIAESIGAGKPPDKEVLRRAQSASHNSNIKFARENFYNENSEVLKLAEGKPAMPPVGEVLAMPVYEREKLLDGNYFAALVAAVPTKQDAKNLLRERTAVFGEAIRNYDSGAKDEIAKKYAQAETGFVSEFGKAAKKTTASIGAGALGMIPKEVQPELAELKDVFLDYMKSPELTPSDTSSAMNFIGRSTGSVVPYVMATVVTGGLTAEALAGTISAKIAQSIGAGTIAFATMGEEAKQNALDKGASEQEAELERLIVGGGSAVLMAVQVDKLFRFANPTAQKMLIDNITQSTKNAMIQSGGRLTKEVVALGINGGVTMAAQEGLIIATPAYLRDEYPKTPGGNPDWFAIATQMTEAGAGGAFANIIVGGGFRSYESVRTSGYKNKLARLISITENLDYATSKKVASNILHRQLDGQGDFDGLYKEEVGKYRLPAQVTVEPTVLPDIPVTAKPTPIPPRNRMDAIRDRINQLVEASKTPEGVKNLERFADEMTALDTEYEFLKNLDNRSVDQLVRDARRRGIEIPKHKSKQKLIRALRWEDTDLARTNARLDQTNTDLRIEAKEDGTYDLMIPAGEAGVFNVRNFKDVVAAEEYANTIVNPELQPAFTSELTPEMRGRKFWQEKGIAKEVAKKPQWATVEEALAAEGLLKPLKPGSKESQRAAEIRGQYNTSTPHPEKLPEDFVKANMGKVKPSIVGKIGKLVTSIGKGIDFLAGDMLTRAQNISPEVGVRISEYIHGVRKRTTDWIQGVEPFLRKVEAITDESDRRRMELAARNLSEGDIDDLVKKYNLEAEYQTFRNTMDDAYNNQKAVGVDMDYRRTYFPLSIKDLDGLLEFLGTTEKHSLIEESINKKKAKQGGRPLSEEQKISLVNSLLRGYTTDNISLARPGHAKERTLGIIDSQIEQFLHDWDTSVIHYLEKSANVVEQRRFFGKQSDEVVAARKTVEALKTRIFKLKNESLIDEDRIRTASKKLNELQDAYESLNEAPVDESIAAEVTRLAEGGKLTSSQQKDLQGILTGIFNRKPTGKVMRTAIRWTYYDLLNNVTQYLTQLGDLSFSLYRAPLQFPKAFGKALVGKSDITLHDIYVHPLGQEWTDSGLETFGEKIMFAIRKGDTVGKETFINSVFENYRAKLQKDPMRERKRLTKVFGKETATVIADLQAGKVSENVKYLLATELSGIQPISIADMPEGYAKSGNMRFLYVLKSFSLKRLDFMRTESCFFFSHPNHKPKDFMTGMGRLIWMTTLFTATGASTDLVKDFIYGKPIDVSDELLNNFLQIFLLSRYAVRKVKEGAKGVLTQNIFPTKSIDNASKDLVVHLSDNEDGKGWELVKSIPLVGDILYWRFGEGRRKLEERTPSE
jgi:hypothetical protein